MRIVFADAKPVHLPGLTRHEQVQISLADEVLSTFDIAKRLSLVAQTDDLVCINVLLATADEPDGGIGGITLLKFLRLLNVRNQVWLYNSVRPAEDWIRRFPHHLILLSNGVELYADLLKPNDFDAITELKGCSSPLDDRHYWEPVFRADFSVPATGRHSLANIWGILRCVVVQSIMSGDNYPVFEEYPLAVQRLLKSLTGQQALYLFNHTQHLFEQAYLQTEVQQQEKQKLFDGLLSKLQVFAERLEESETELNQVQTEKEQIWRLQQSTDYLYTDYRQITEKLIQIEEFDIKPLYETWSDLVESTVLRTDQADQALSEVKVRMKLLIDDARESVNQHIGSSIKRLHNNLKTKTIRVLHIDDQVADGWDRVVRFAIVKPNEGQGNYKSIIPTTGQSIAELYSDIKTQILQHQPDVVLLDLRLFDEKGHIENPKDLSGSQILVKIREDFPALPVIITTASNKSVSAEALFWLGCDGYWVKEGMDYTLSAEESVRNYQKLLQLIDSCCSSEYKGMVKFRSICDKISKANTVVWWEGLESNFTDHEGDKCHHFAERKVVSDLAKDTWVLYCDYLRRKSVGTLPKSEFAWLHISNIYQSIGKIIEAIHGTHVLKVINRNKEYIGNLDKEGARLHDLRSQYSHLKYLGDSENGNETKGKNGNSKTDLRKVIEDLGVYLLKSTR